MLVRVDGMSSPSIYACLVLPSLLLLSGVALTLALRGSWLALAFVPSLIVLAAVTRFMWGRR